MKKCTYNERVYIDSYRVIDYVKEFYYLSSWQCGGLTYFKTDRYNTKVIETSLIIAM